MSGLELRRGENQLMIHQSHFLFFLCASAWLTCEQKWYALQAWPSNTSQMGFARLSLCAGFIQMGHVEQTQSYPEPLRCISKQSRLPIRNTVWILQKQEIINLDHLWAIMHFGVFYWIFMVGFEWNIVGLKRKKKKEGNNMGVVAF